MNCPNPDCNQQMSTTRLFLGGGHDTAYYRCIPCDKNYKKDSHDGKGLVPHDCDDLTFKSDKAQPGSTGGAGPQVQD